MSEGREHLQKAPPGHETRDASVATLVAFGLILFGLVILGLLVSWRVEAYFVAHQSLGPAGTPFENVRQTPPANRPELQSNPARDLDRFTSKQEETLESYGWVDAKAGIARIPIERAMAILIQKGFPTATSGAAAPLAKTNRTRGPTAERKR